MKTLDLYNAVHTPLNEHYRRFGVIPKRLPVSQEVFNGLYEWWRENHGFAMHDQEQATLGYNNVIFGGVACYVEADQ